MLSRIDGMRQSSDENLNEQLAIAASISRRELEILREISIALSNREAAEIFSISPGTVKTHLENIIHNSLPLP